MSFEEYKAIVEKYSGRVGKINLLGGEPTIHPELEKMLDFNRWKGFKTTIYTNGFDLKRLEKMDMRDVSLRVGVYGSTSSEKPLSQVFRTPLPLYVVYMLRKDNVSELAETADMAERDFNTKSFYISSIRDIDATQDFWKDTPETVSMPEYAGIVQDFVKNYSGGIQELHIARRGVLETDQEFDSTYNCRFGNIFPDGEMITCPLDISRKLTTPELDFNKRPCNKNDECLLRKIVLRKKK
jgi:hypothetical protein